MNIGYPHINHVWADLIIEELTRNDITHFFLSSGSRSSPLTAAVALCEKARSHIHFDERGSGFAAVGCARATGRPAVLICTSGTAAGNFFPAVIEAAMDQVPLLVLTADRPSELRFTGANQTIDQSQLYGDYPRWFVDLPCPTEQIPPQFILTTIDQAVFRSLRTPPGPVHINCMFREPLARVGSEQDYGEYLQPTEAWRNAADPFTSYSRPVSMQALPSLERAARFINDAQKGILLAGRVGSEKNRNSICKLARALGWPVFADIASGMRCAPSLDNNIPYYDLLLSEESFRQHQGPQAVLHLGSQLTSKQVLLWLERARPQHYIHVADHPLRQDQSHQVTTRIECDIAHFIDFILPFLRAKTSDTDWLDGFTSATNNVAVQLDKRLDLEGQISEPAVARLISRNIPINNFLFLANSLPIRDMDIFADPGGAEVPVVCNRGASGIDGNIATAVGYALGSGKPGTVLIGDLAFLHDVNSLAMLRSLDRQLTIAVVNNNGGGIFSFLPIAERDDIFEEFWGTPHGLTFSNLARQFDLQYVCPANLIDFTNMYVQACTGRASSIIEVTTDRNENYQLHQRIRTAITRTLSAE